MQYARHVRLRKIRLVSVFLILWLFTIFITQFLAQIIGEQSVMALPTPPKLHEHEPSVSEMAIEYLSYHLELYRARQNQFLALKKEPSLAFTLGNVPQLRDVAISGIVKSLREDPGGETVGIITDSIPSHLLESVMSDPRINYNSFRRINVKRVEEVVAGEGDEVDEWIQKNEKWMRVDGTNQGLVTLEDAKAIFPAATYTSTEIIIPRRQPPLASFCFLDQKRPSSISILPSTDRFIETFNRVTNNCLKGLDWNNVFLAGGMPLNVLLCTDPSMDQNFTESDLDIYIYGLDPNSANEKIKHIYEIWCTNVGEKSVKAGICVKNTKTVNFLGKFPDRRIQIVLKAVKSPAEVLLNFDLDPCAIGFDGTNILMLPRAARALETGYTTFTMHLVHGHHLGDRRATQELRVYKYASRGFGIRIPSCYMDDLILDTTKRRPHGARTTNPQIWTNPQSSQKILEGLKAVKRIAFAAEDMVRRFVLNEVDGTVDHDPGEFDARNWVEMPHGNVPVCSFKVLDALKQHIGQPGGRVGIGSFELFFRHCAAWKLEHEGRLKIDYNDFADTYATEGAYDDLPSFSWDQDFKAERFVRDIDSYNLRLHRNMLGSFDHMEDGRSRWEECQLKDMEIRPARMTCAKTLQGVMDQQLAFPIFIPTDLEEFFEKAYNNAMKFAGLSDLLFHRHVNADGNLIVRLWLIGNQTMWARIDRTIDEIFESLWTFFHIQQLTPGHVCTFNGGDDDDYFDESTMLYLVREHLERRVPRPVASGRAIDTSQGSGTIHNFFVWPSEEEKRLFDIWMGEYPREVYRGDDAPFCSTGSFTEEDNWKEPDEDKYWGSEDEKEEGRVWRDMAEDTKRKRKRIDSQLIEGGELQFKKPVW